MLKYWVEMNKKRGKYLPKLKNSKLGNKLNKNNVYNKSNSKLNNIKFKNKSIINY